MIIYTVRRGDTLYSIARRFGSDAERLAADNGLTRPEALGVGESLVISEPKSVYTVREGDDLYSIAQRFGVSVGDLWRNNSFLGGGYEIRPGETLTIVSEAPLYDREIAVNAYVYPTVDRSILRHMLPYLTYLTVLGYAPLSDGTLLEPQGDDEIVELARAYGVAPILQLAGTDADGALSNESAARVLSDDRASATLLSELEGVLSSKRYRGISVSFEGLPAELSEAYAAWISALRQRLLPSGRTVFVSLIPRTSDAEADWYGGVQNVRRLGEAADAAELAAYGWGYTYGPPMAVAPLPEVRAAIAYATERIPSEQLLLGTSQYGYHWQLPFVAGEGRARGLDYAETMHLARARHSAVEYDAVVGAPYLRWFAREDGRMRENVAWFEDARSLSERLRLVEDYGLGGVSLWNAMRYAPWWWQVLAHTYLIRKIWE